MYRVNADCLECQQDWNNGISSVGLGPPLIGIMVSIYWKTGLKFGTTAYIIMVSSHSVRCLIGIIPSITVELITSKPKVSS